MTNQNHYNQLEKMYLSVFFNAALTSSITVSKEQCEIKSTITKDYFHAANALHGSIMFKTLDDVGFFAAQSVVEDYFLVTASFNTHFIRPVFEEPLKAIGKVIEQTKRQIICESVTYNDTGKKVAYGTGTFVKSKQPLRELGGYLIQ